MNGVWARALSIITTTSSNCLALSSYLSHPYINQLLGRMYIDVDMANNSRYYYSLPMQAPQQPRSTSGTRRPPLTPSTVSSPCLTTQSTIASRRDSGSGSPTKASALLAKVASHPSTPRGETPSSSPIPSPEARMHSNPMYSSNRPAMWRSESARYVHQYRQQGKQHQP